MVGKKVWGLHGLNSTYELARDWGGFPCVLALYTAARSFRSWVRSRDSTMGEFLTQKKR